MQIQNKIIVVTGAGGGIGGEVVAHLVAKGAKVAAVDLRQEALDAMKAKLGEQHADKVSLHAVNISDKEAVAQLPATVVAAHGAVDGIFNVAGIIQPFVKINELEFDAIERVMNVNFYGTLFMVKAFLPTLLERPEAHIVNVSSMGGFLPVPGQGIYGASKAAVKLMTEALYAELLTTNVKVSVVFPGATNTQITQNSNVSGPGGAASAADADKMGVKMLSASDAAAQIIAGVEKNKVQIYTGSDSKLMNRLYRLNPVSATKLIAKQMQALLK